MPKTKPTSHDDDIRALLAEEVAIEEESDRDFGFKELDLRGGETSVRASLRMFDMEESDLLFEDYDMVFDDDYLPPHSYKARACDLGFEDPAIWETDYGTFRMDLSVLH